MRRNGFDRVQPRINPRSKELLDVMQQRPIVKPIRVANHLGPADGGCDIILESDARRAAST